MLWHVLVHRGGPLPKHAMMLLDPLRVHPKWHALLRGTPETAHGGALRDCVSFPRAYAHSSRPRTYFRPPGEGDGQGSGERRRPTAQELVDALGEA